MCSKPASTSITPEIHRTLAVGLFNLAWTHLENPDRTPSDNVAMLNAAHASRWHWSKVGSPTNAARGEWQVSRVYAVLLDADGARRHGGESLEICRMNDLSAFDLSFALEAMARATHVAGEGDEVSEFQDQGLQAAEQIEDEQDRRWAIANLRSLETPPVWEEHS